jgi:hypothetical protein
MAYGFTYLKVTPVRKSYNNKLPNTFGDPLTTSCSNLPAPYQAGILRGVSTGGGTGAQSNSLAQNWPNPTSTGITLFAYQLQPGAATADLLVRRATDGREMKRTVLDVQAKAVALSVKGWPAGTYFATLVVNGVPGETRRIVVE